MEKKLNSTVTIYNQYITLAGKIGEELAMEWIEKNCSDEEITRFVAYKNKVDSSNWHVQTFVHL